MIFGTVFSSRVLPNEAVHCRPSAGLRPHADLSIQAHSPRSKINQARKFHVVGFCAGPHSVLIFELTAMFSDDQDDIRLFEFAVYGHHMKPSSKVLFREAAPVSWSQSRSMSVHIIW